MGRGARLPFIPLDPDAVLYRSRRTGSLLEVKPCGAAGKYFYVRMHGYPHFHRRAAHTFMPQVKRVRMR